ncbi:hypothetical protein [Rhodovibrio sodomensis]|uniref:hypothetical protein n=1 Tax=Rhodovibrio sodomensis TaxID=1088 RepID=UPI001907EF8C|nr:hypothetical protein [Rhodovibrio sodomensis]
MQPVRITMLAGASAFLLNAAAAASEFTSVTSRVDVSNPEVFADQFDDPFTESPYAFPVDDGDLNTSSPSSISSQYNLTYDGVNSYGESSTFTVSGENRAQAGFGRLKASTVATFDSPLPPEDNEPYVYDGSGPVFEVATNPDGVPSIVQPLSRASFSDTLELESVENIESVQLKFDLTGINSITAPINSPLYFQSSVFVSDTYGSIFSDQIDSGAGLREYNETITSNLFPVSDGRADISFTLDTELALTVSDFTGDLPRGLEFFGANDFYNTFEFLSLTAFNSDGEEIIITDVRGTGGGDIYLSASATPVPLPATIWLILVGGLPLACAKIGVRISGKTV